MTDLRAILDAGGPWQDARLIGGQLLILGDCLDVLPTLEKVDALLCDPPFGIKQAQGMGTGGFSGFGDGVRRNRHARRYKGDWDNTRPPPEAFEAMLAAADLHIIWGGQYFADLLPARGKWLWWDKCQTMPSYGDGELAWTSLSGEAPKKFVYSNNGLMAREKDRQHPTQKPIALMEWCLGFLPNANTILDPFMGSGTTLVACQRLGRQGIGIELDRDYFEIACKRVQDVVDRPPLFTPEPPKPTQDAMDL